MKNKGGGTYWAIAVVTAVILAMICTTKLNRNEDEMLQDVVPDSYKEILSEETGGQSPGTGEETGGQSPGTTGQVGRNANRVSTRETTEPSPGTRGETTEPSPGTEGETGEPSPGTESLWEKYHGEINSVAMYDEAELPRIVCWGDSLTETNDGKTSYPEVLSELTGVKVLNYGVHSETTRMIAMREGAVAVYADEVILPAECVPVEISLHNSIGTRVTLLVYGDAGINPCSLCGISGQLSRVNGSYYFTRSEAGLATVIPDSTRLKTFGQMNGKSDDVVILFSGTNDGLTADTAADLVKSQGMILEDLKSDKYVVIGLTYNDSMKNVTKINALLEETYGEHFLDLYEYLMNFGLEDAGLKENAIDSADIGAGRIPSSLRVDAVHGNKYFNRLLAEQVNRKLQELGYLPLN